jgi:hypothetical protein
MSQAITSLHEDQPSKLNSAQSIKGKLPPETKRVFLSVQSSLFNKTRARRVFERLRMTFPAVEFIDCDVFDGEPDAKNSRNQALRSCDALILIVGNSRTAVGAHVVLYLKMRGLNKPCLMINVQTDVLHIEPCGQAQLSAHFPSANDDDD